MSDNDIASGVPTEGMLDQIRGQAIRRGSTPATPALPTPGTQGQPGFGAPSEQTLQQIRNGALDRAPR
jgi:hypothetical protein